MPPSTRVTVKTAPNLSTEAPGFRVVQTDDTPSASAGGAGPGPTRSGSARIGAGDQSHRLRRLELMRPDGPERRRLGIALPPLSGRSSSCPPVDLTLSMTRRALLVVAAEIQDLLREIPRRSSLETGRGIGAQAHLAEPQSEGPLDLVTSSANGACGSRRAAIAARARAPNGRSSVSIRLGRRRRGGFAGAHPEPAQRGGQERSLITRWELAAQGAVDGDLDACSGARRRESSGCSKSAATLGMLSLPARPGGVDRLLPGALSCAAPRAASFGVDHDAEHALRRHRLHPEPRRYTAPRRRASAARAFAELFTNGWRAPVSSRSRLVIPRWPRRRRGREPPPVERPRSPPAGSRDATAAAGSATPGSARKIHSGVAVTIQVAAGWQVVGSVRDDFRRMRAGRGALAPPAAPRLRWALMAAGLNRRRSGRPRAS